MFQQVLSVAILALAAAAPQKTHNLPVLFQFSHPTHNVAVFRGADLQRAIAAGVVKGFGAGAADADAAAADAGEEDREGRSEDEESEAASYAAPTTTPAPTTTTAPPPPPTTTAAYVAPTTVAPTYTPAPAVYKPAIKYVYKPVAAPVAYKPAPVVYKPAPAPVVYKPAPAPAYKAAATYAEPAYPAEPALYTWEYAVKDDYSNNDFGAKEARDGYLTNGKYYVALPDGRLQTVTYTVDGEAGYVPVVEYAGEAQYPDTPAPYSA